MLRRPLIPLVVLFLLPALRVGAEPRHFHLAAGDEAVEVRFRSEATLESFEGHTRDLSGYVRLDPDDLSGVSGEIVVDLASLDTGIGLRNKHMRDNVLHTDEHPTARFVVEGAEAGALGAEAVSTVVRGTFSLHGVSKPLSAEVVARLDGPDLVFEATFTITLADFEIERPKMLMLKVAETVALSIRARARPGPAPKRSAP